MSGWIGIDLDGTLAEDSPGEEFDPSVIGAPVEAMVKMVKQFLQDGQSVKIFTARVSESDPIIVETINKWCLEHLGQILPATNVKDFKMRALYDDRAFRVERNTGRIIGEMG